MTTAHILSTVSFHLLDNPNILDRLQRELENLMSSENPQPTWQQLERLPYLVRELNMYIYQLMIKLLTLPKERSDLRRS